MRRCLAATLLLLSPGMLLMAMTVCCAFSMAMPDCHMPPSCHEPDALRPATCCASFDAGPAKTALHSGQFTPAPPHEFPADVSSTLTEPLLEFASGAPLVFGSPPVFNLRI